MYKKWTDSRRELLLIQKDIIPLVPITEEIINNPLSCLPHPPLPPPKKIPDQICSHVVHINALCISNN